MHTLTEGSYRSAFSYQRDISALQTQSNTSPFREKELSALSVHVCLYLLVPFFSIKERR